MKSALIPLASALAFIPNFAFGTMMPDPDTLPLSAQDLETAKSVLGSEEAFEQFRSIITSARFYPDHMNPKELAKIDDKSVAKIYHAVPYFQASAERSVVGTQEVATYAIDLLHSTDQLVGSLGFNLKQKAILEARIGEKDNLIKNFRNRQAAREATQADRDYLETLIKSLESDIAQINTQLIQLQNEGRDELSSVPSNLQKEIIFQLAYTFSSLGITLSPDEKLALEGKDFAKMQTAILALRSRVANGQMALRQVVFEHGFSKEQREAFAVYKRLRPDVNIVSLAPDAVYAKAGAQTYLDSSADDKPLHTIPTLLIRGVNAGTKGKCGAALSCNVVIEYTEAGAREVLTSMSGGVGIPVTFEADVVQMLPEFDGTVSCHYENGFRVNGRMDVKDGAVIYDGDVTNKISVNGINTGKCQFDIRKGSQESAHYAALDLIYKKYMDLQYDRTQRSEADVRQYNEYLQSEAQRHAAQSQGQEQESIWSRVTTWIPVFGGAWGTVAAGVVSAARNFYWHTRIEDRSVINRVDFDTTISIKNLQAKKNVDFDGYTKVCWRRLDGRPVMTACPAGVNATTEAERAVTNEQMTCNLTQSPSECNQAVTQQPVDDNGVITAPDAPW